MRYALLLALVCELPLMTRGDDPTVIPLWEKGAPGFENLKDEKEHRNVQKSGEYNVTNVHNPSLTVFLPPKDKATGVAVVIAPGGGHRELWVLHEGEYVANWLNHHGVAFVLRYRLAREKGSKYQIAEHALQDGQRAMRLVRSRAKEWGVNPARFADRAISLRRGSYAGYAARSSARPLGNRSAPPRPGGQPGASDDSRVQPRFPGLALGALQRAQNLISNFMIHRLVVNRQRSRRMTRT